MLNVHHLEIFHTVAALESYSRAAERLGISQPAVSMQLRKLEEAVGVPLVVQRGRQLELTEAGRVLAAFARRIFQLNDEAEAAMADFRELRRGRLRIAASSTPGAYLVPAKVAAFRAEHPDVVVTLTIGNTRSSLAAVAEGLADLAVVGDAATEGGGVLLEPLCEDALVLVVSPAHPWAQAAPVTARALAAEPLLVREPGSSTREVLDRRLAALGLKPNPLMELASTDAVREGAVAGLGPAVLSGLAVRADLASGRLVRVPLADLCLSRTLRMALPGDRPATPLAARFAETVLPKGGQGGCCP